MAENFLIDRDGSITTITFNRPEKRNCLDEAIILDFEHHLQAVRDDRDCRVLIVTGKGSAFCAGADQSMFKSSPEVDAAERRRRMGEFKRWPRLIGRAFDVLAHLDQITIGAINGYAVGGGWSFVLAFDFDRGRRRGVLGPRSRSRGALSRCSRRCARCAARAVAGEGGDPDVPALQGRGAARDGCAQSGRQAR